MESKPVTHTHHHLPHVCYVGDICVAITAKVENGKPIFSKSDVVATFAETLQDCAVKKDCLVPVYCFMPEHLHMLIQGTKESSDTWRVITQFKQRTGYWLSKHSNTRW
jgi:putative transposase